MSSSDDSPGARANPPASGPPAGTAPLRVTAAILRRPPDPRVLVARRAPGKDLAGYWEFPGGKIEAGETPEACLARELREEFDVEVLVRDFVARSVHAYPTRTVELLAFAADHVAGEFRLRDHDAIQWVAPHDLPTIRLAPADVPLVATLLAAAPDPTR